MNQVKIGEFLRELRKEKGLTQEQFAEQFNISRRSVSRWETGSNMPDVGLLIEIADFFEVDIREIIDGERKSENMDKETRETANAMAEYGKNEIRTGKRKVIGILLAAFGLFIIITALSIFPSDSSWGSIYSVLGSIVLIAGVYIMIRIAAVKRVTRILTVIACIVLLFAVFTLTDYIAVSAFNQVPRFRYKTEYDSRNPDQLVHKTLFFTAVQKDPGTKNERVYILNKTQAAKQDPHAAEYKVTLIDDGLITEKPSGEYFAPGTVLTFRTDAVCDADLGMYVDGELYGIQNAVDTDNGYIWEYTFEMPPKDVVVEFRISGGKPY